MRERKKEQTKKELLAAAKTMLHQEGFEKITVRKLAEATGYSYTSLYYYFRDLSALYLALRLDLIEDMIEEIRSIPIHSEDPVEEVVLLFDVYVSYFLAHPELFRFLYFYEFKMPAEDDEAKALDERFQGMWQTSFQRLLSEGILQMEDLPSAAKSIIFMLHGRILLHLSSQDGWRENQLKNEIQQLIRYILKVK